MGWYGPCVVLWGMGLKGWGRFGKIIPLCYRDEGGHKSLFRERKVCMWHWKMVDGFSWLFVGVFLFIIWKRNRGNSSYYDYIKENCVYKLVLCFFNRIKNIIYTKW